MLGWVAAVSATESPSQLSPALIQRTWTTGSAESVGDVPLVGASVAIAGPPPHCMVGGTDVARPCGRPGRSAVAPGRGVVSPGGYPTCTPVARR